MDACIQSIVPISLYIATRRAKKELYISSTDLRHLGVVWYQSNIGLKYTMMNHLAPLRGGRSLTSLYKSMDRLVRQGLVHKAKGNAKVLGRRGLAGATGSWWCLSPKGRKVYEDFVRMIVESNKKVLSDLNNDNRPIKNAIRI